LVTLQINKYKTPPLFRNGVSIISSWYHPYKKGSDYLLTF